MVERCELAATGFIASDLQHMLARAKEQDEGQKAGSFSMSTVTLDNYQQMCVTALQMSASLPPNLGLNPKKLTEMTIEHWFKYLRDQHQTRKMTARDYDIASVRQMMDFANQKHRHYIPIDKALLGKISAAEFRAALDRALDAVLTLFCLITPYTKEKFLGC